MRRRTATSPRLRHGSFARGGKANLENVEVRCRGHNQHEAVQEFGDRALFVREAAPAYVINSVRTESLMPGAARQFIRGAFVKPVRRRKQPGGSGVSAELAWSVGQYTGAARTAGQTARRTTAASLPPNASDVETTQSTGISRASFATTSTSHSGSVSV